MENSSAGSVSEVYGLILEHRFFIAAATTLRVRHCLAAPPSADPARIRDVYSHRQALAQCSQFLARHGYVPQPYSNTAAAAKMAAERGGDLAVICSEQAAETHGLRILERGIQNSSGNRTRFIAISRTLTIPDDAQKISLCFSLPHTTGSLYHVLARFAVAGLNLTKIESRPISSEGRLFEYDFYLDFTGNLREEPTLEFIASLQAELPDFSFLGNYREQEEPAEALQFQKVAPPRQIETLAALASKIWHEHYTPLLGAAQVDYMVEKFQSAPALAHQMEHEGYTYYLLLLDGVPALYGLPAGAGEDVPQQAVCGPAIPQAAFGRARPGFFAGDLPRAGPDGDLPHSEPAQRRLHRRLPQAGVLCGARGKGGYRQRILYGRLHHVP